MRLQKRISRELGPLQHKRPVECHVFLDCESNWGKLSENNKITRHTLRFGCASFAQWNGARLETQAKCEFFKASEFWEWLQGLQLKGRTWVWAHNIAFDGTLIELWSRLAGPECELYHFTDCNLPAFFQCEIKGQSYQFIDSLNFFRQSLASIGEEMGLPKLAMPKQEDDIKEWMTYCWRDVEVLQQVINKWMQFIDIHQLGPMGPSLASQAMTAYRTKFYTHAIHLHCSKVATQLERASYYGGIVEPKFIGKVEKGPIYELDINSLYPFVMKHNKFPVLFENFERFPSKRRVEELIRKYYVIGQVKIETTNSVYPVREKGRLLFPHGSYSTVLSGPEFIRAWKQGDVKQVRLIACYEQESIFSGFVDYFYEQRWKYKNKGDNTFQYMCKILLNSLYGKFGQKRYYWEPYSEELLELMELKGVLNNGSLQCLKEHIELRVQYEDTFTHPENGIMYGARWLMNQPQLLNGVGEAPNSFPAIAGAVTAYAREYVRSIMAMIPKQCLYYSDTDSFFVNERGRTALKTAGMIGDNLLGKLKLNTVNDWMVIHAPKDYQTNNEVKLKGVRGKAIKVCEGVYLQEQWPGFKKVIKDHSKSKVDVITIKKTLKREITTVRVGVSGWTHPLLVQLDNEELI